MIKRIHKWAALALVLCMILVWLPATPAHAVEALSGTCGDNLTWSLSSSGILTISGTGKMDNYFGNAPWHNVRASIVAVVIKDGVTSIGDDAFYDCASLSSITIPASVTSIGNLAFAYCGSLKSVTIPDGVTGIGLSVFAYCSSLKSITIPASVTYIGMGAFARCSGLTSIVFEGDAPTIHSMAFTKVTATVYYPAGNNTWTADVMKNYDGTLTWTTGQRGDTNMDGIINYLDAMLIAQFYVGDIEEDALNVAAADVNGDGKVDYLDAMLIAQFYVGDIDSLN